MSKNHNWSIKTRDFRIQRNSGIPKTEAWIVEGDDTLYYSHQAAITSHYYSHRDSHAFDMAMNYQYFDYQWGFQGWLGYQYQKEKTEFHLWGPTAAKVDLIFYQTTDDKSSIDYIVPMERGDIINLDNHLYNTHGVWFATIEHDLDYQAYAYRVYYRDKIFQDTRDPYSIATMTNGRRSVILAQEHRNPKGFSVKQGKEAYWRLDNPNQAVITELHIRDFSKSLTSGVAELYRGKFLGACQSGTHNSYGDETGFDYLKKLGISHVQLQPIFDHHQTFDADGNYAYNWGYDPENFNVPEASFSTVPHKPENRILELKQLIQAYHFAKLVIKVINELANLINNDISLNGKLKVVFLENYNVSLAELIIPAANVSEQISLASKEASGASNMKFMMTGAITLATLDGANIEIKDEVGSDNIVIFGMDKDDVYRHYERHDYYSRSIYENNTIIRCVVDSFINGTIPNIQGEGTEIYESLIMYNDEYFLLEDFTAYVEAQEKIDQLYRNQDQWMRMSFINIANSDKFISDDTITQYAKEIWQLKN